MKKVLFFLFLVFSLFGIPAAQASQSNYTGHDSISVSSAVSLTEESSVRFGNFTVTAPGDSNASIVLDHHGTRTVYNGGTTMITLLNGGTGGTPDVGAQEAGHYRIAGAGSGANIYVTFTDHAGTAISSGNPIVLTGPVGSNDFYVDTLTFNLRGTDGTGSYVTTDSGGNATIRVGATLHTVSGATTYAPGTYTGTFEVMISY